MGGLGAYRPDPTEGITAIADLPQPEIVPYSRNDKRNVCPRCGHGAYRDKQSQRTLHDLGNLDLWCPRDLVVTYSQPYCTKCRKYFNADLSDLAPPGSHYTHRVIDLAVRIVVEDGLPYRPASWHLWRDHRVFVPFATIQNWVEAGGKKSTGTHGPRLPKYLDTNFSILVSSESLLCNLSQNGQGCLQLPGLDIEKTYMQKMVTNDIS